MSDNNFKKLGIAPVFTRYSPQVFTPASCPERPAPMPFVALVIWYLLYLVLSPLALTLTTLALIVVTTVVGAWTSSVMERYWGPDPRAVVIDEYVGCWIPLLVAPAGEYTWIFALAGFALFRIIDITKPLGCRRIEQVCPGGWGVMMDDVLAGSYALIIVYILKLLFL